MTIHTEQKKIISDIFFFLWNSVAWYWWWSTDWTAHFPQILTSNIYTGFLQNDPLREDSSANTNTITNDLPAWRGTRDATQYLNEEFPDRWIGRSGLQN
jgi:hypothetical protein